MEKLPKPVELPKFRKLRYAKPPPMPSGNELWKHLNTPGTTCSLCGTTSVGMDHNHSQGHQDSESDIEDVD